MKKQVIAGITALVMVVLLIITGIYYTAAMSDRATYKRQTQALIVETFADLKKTESGGSPEKNLSAFKQLKKDAADSAEKLKSRPAPGGGQELKANAVQVTDLADSIADRGILLFTYITNVDKVIESWEEEIKTAGSISDPVARLQGFQSVTATTTAELKDLKPPASLISFHLQITDLMATMSARLGEMVVAANAKDAAKLAALSTDWDRLSTQFNTLSAPDNQEISDNIMPPADRRKLKQLSNKIDES